MELLKHGLESRLYSWPPRWPTSVLHPTQAPSNAYGLLELCSKVWNRSGFSRQWCRSLEVCLVPCTGEWRNVCTAVFCFPVSSDPVFTQEGIKAHRGWGAVASLLRFCCLVSSVAHSQPMVPENTKWTILEVINSKLWVTRWNLVTTMQGISHPRNSQYTTYNTYLWLTGLLWGSPGTVPRYCWVCVQVTLTLCKSS